MTDIQTLSGLPRGIAVYGASSDHIPAACLDAARAVGELTADAGLPLICGGGRGGVMAAAIEGALSHGGVTVGVLPQFMIEREWNHPGLTHTIATPDMHTRKRTMAALSRAAIAMPGGIGTFDELFELATWRQLHLYTGPLVLCNTDGYYDILLEMLDRAAQLGFMRPGQPSRLVLTATTPGHAVEAAVNNSSPETGLL